MQHPPSRFFHGEALEPRLLLSRGYALTADTSFIPAPDGIYPTSLVIDRNGNLFGATEQGGTWNDGTVFEIPNGTTTVQTLVNFDSTVGSGPEALAIDPNGDLFGTTGVARGTPGGNVFEISAGSGTATLVSSFDGPVDYAPSLPLIYFNGNLYGAGTEQLPGSSGSPAQSVVFALNPNTGVFTDLVSFDPTHVPDPDHGLVLTPDGNLIGETFPARAGVHPTVFEISPDTGALTTLATLDNSESPVGGLAVDAAGDIFGATESTTTFLPDRIFEIPQGARAAETIVGLGGNTISGSVDSLTLDAVGDLYGTAVSGSPDDFGTIFEVPQGTNTLTRVVSFNLTDGRLTAPTIGLLLGPNGDLFGATGGGGTTNDGTVFRITDNELVTLANFTDTGPSQPSGPLFSDPNGNLFGSTSAGGTNKDGTVFEIPRGRSGMTVIASFDTPVLKPAGNLVMDASGDLFGTEPGSNYGNVYELPRDSTTITMLAIAPRLEPDLAVDANGDLFGVIGEGTSRTASGKIVRLLPASIFEIPHGASTPSTVVQFGRGVEPGAISLDSSGDIFGMFSNPGSADWTIYDIAHGSRTVNPLGKAPPNSASGPLAVDSADDLFGTIAGVADGSTAAVFELPHGARLVEPIAYLRGANDVGLVEPLVVDADGNVFGAASGMNVSAGTNAPGAVFEIPKGSAAVTTLISFNGTDGSGPLGITLDPSGNLAGATSAGGRSGNGAFFELSPADVPPSGATQLVISSLPSSPIAGVPFNPTVAVSILDAAGQVVTTDNSTVTLSWDEGQTTNVLTAAAVNGVATFPNVVIDQSGPVSLSARDGALEAGDYLDVNQALPLVPRLGNIRFPAGTFAGATVNAAVPLTITNTGKAFADTVQIDLYANAAAALGGNQVLLHSFSMPISLPAGRAMTLSLPIRSLPAALPAGTYHLVAKLTESYTVVSVAASTQTVTLAQPFIQPALSVGIVSPATLDAGEIASVSVTVTNQGNVVARGVDLTLSPSSDGVTPIPGVTLDHFQSNIRIAPRHSKTFQLRFQVPGNLTPGDYRPFAACLLAGVTAATAGSVPFTLAASAAPARYAESIFGDTASDVRI